MYYYSILQAVHGYVSDAKSLLWHIPNSPGTSTTASDLRIQNERFTYNEFFPNQKLGFSPKIEISIFICVIQFEKLFRTGFGKFRNK